MTAPRTISVIGVANGAGAGNEDCRQAPSVIKSLALLNDLEDARHVLRWDSTIATGMTVNSRVEAIADMARELAEHTLTHLQQGDLPLVIGGDHSCAIGTWSGVKQFLGPDARLGLVWMDAHMDSHTFSTSPSRNIHGMPLACLLGIGEKCFTSIAVEGPKLHPEDVCLIGVRSFESGEAELLRRLGVKIYFMEEVRHRGMRVVFEEALARVKAHTAGYGISLDLDVIDPALAPGVGTPEPGGITPDEIAAAMETVRNDPKLLTLEIVEYNPVRDRHLITARAIHDICLSLIRSRTEEPLNR